MASYKKKKLESMESEPVDPLEVDNLNEFHLRKLLGRKGLPLTGFKSELFVRYMNHICGKSDPIKTNGEVANVSRSQQDFTVDDAMDVILGTPSEDKTTGTETELMDTDVQDDTSGEIIYPERFPRADIYQEMEKLWDDRTLFVYPVTPRDIGNASTVLEQFMSVKIFFAPPAFSQDASGCMILNTHKVEDTPELMQQLRLTLPTCNSRVLKAPLNLSDEEKAEAKRKKIQLLLTTKHNSKRFYESLCIFGLPPTATRERLLEIYGGLGVEMVEADELQNLGVRHAYMHFLDLETLLNTMVAKWNQSIDGKKLSIFRLNDTLDKGHSLSDGFREILLNSCCKLRLSLNNPRVTMNTKMKNLDTIKRQEYQLTCDEVVRQRTNRTGTTCEEHYKTYIAEHHTDEERKKVLLATHDELEKLLRRMFEEQYIERVVKDLEIEKGIIEEMKEEKQAPHECHDIEEQMAKKTGAVSQSLKEKEETAQQSRAAVSEKLPKKKPETKAQIYKVEADTPHWSKKRTTQREKSYEEKKRKMSGQDAHTRPKNEKFRPGEKTRRANRDRGTKQKPKMVDVGISLCDDVVDRGTIRMPRMDMGIHQPEHQFGNTRTHGMGIGIGTMGHDRGSMGGNRGTNRGNMGSFRGHIGEIGRNMGTTDSNMGTIDRDVQYRGIASRMGPSHSNFGPMHSNTDRGMMERRSQQTLSSSQRNDLGARGSGSRKKKATGLVAPGFKDVSY